MTEPLELIGIRVPKTTKAALEQLAAKEDRPLSNYLRRLFEAHIKSAKKPERKR